MKRLTHIIGILSVFISVFACEREFVFRGGEEGLRFSTDTVMFDTIFTSIGSTTQNFRVFNPYDDDLSIDAIQLVGGSESSFRLNINGYAEDELNDVRVRGKDSLYVFVEVTIDPKGVNTPFVVTDSILFYTREKVQSIKLVAYGQDVILLRKEWLKTQTFTKDKPYLIYDYIVVDSLQTLTVDPGARLYFNKDASLLVLGKLEVNGTTEEPVLFSSHRQEEWYQDKPGQWGYIHLLPGSGRSRIDNAIIKNGLMGLMVDSVGTGKEGPIRITNTRIEHVSSFGLLAQSAGIEAGNCLIADCGTHSASLTIGGNYSFNHCTFANYFDWAFRTTPAVFLSNYYLDENNKEQIVPLKKADFLNCIIYGRNMTEIGFDLKKVEGDVMNYAYLFDHCVLKVPDDFDLSDEKYFKKIIRKDPSFVDYTEYNYQLDTLSVAKDEANSAFSQEFPDDILGVDRFEDEGPDRGCFERKEKN